MIKQSNDKIYQETLRGQNTFFNSRNLIRKNYHDGMYISPNGVADFRTAFCPVIYV